MKFWLKWLIGIGLVVALLVGAGYSVQQYFKQRNQPKWRTVEVVEGALTFAVNATGKVQPLHRVSIGAFVSGPVDELLVDYNSRVTKGSY